MKSTRARQHIAIVALFAAGLLGAGVCAEAQQETALYSFVGNQAISGGPVAGVIFDASGNLYGTTIEDGNNVGTVFELSPAAGGGWSEKTIYTFAANGSGDGNFPASNLVFDASGNLYGTTQRGGSASNPPFGYGTVFELTPAANGEWTEKVLYSFQKNGKDGNFPQAALVIDVHGNLFGTTSSGGTYNYGTVFELVRTANGNWTEKVLHSFGNASDGKTPFAGLIFDASGDLYGTTTAGGAFQSGTAFELLPAASGTWKEKVLHSFGSGNDGAQLVGGLIFDSVGNLYGTTSTGGGSRVGTVFELIPSGSGGWASKILHNFSNNGSDGENPSAGLVMDPAGNLYGTTSSGGAISCGTVFKLSSTGQSAWTEKILYSFNFSDGCDPNGALIMDASGNLFGTTFLGGANGGGEVFEIVPQ